MHEAWTHQLETWHEFFLLIGTAGFTLTGLVFVVVSLGPGVVTRRQTTGVRAFVSPNVVYLTTTLVVSAVLLVPVLPVSILAALLVVGASASLGYIGYAGPHQQWRSSDLPVLDWIWNVALPIVSYLLLLASGVGFWFHVALAMHGVAVASILLLVISIRNAWDLVIWITREERK